MGTVNKHADSMHMLIDSSSVQVSSYTLTKSNSTLVLPQNYVL